MTTVVTVRGGDTLARTLRGFADDVAHLDAAHAAAGAAVIAKARPRTRRRTGALAASWTSVITVDGSRIGSSLRYAAVQEYGSRARHITASRALTGGLDTAVGDVDRIYTTAVDGAMGKVRGA